MKVGSLVICTYNVSEFDMEIAKIRGSQLPVKDVIYTVRQVRKVYTIPGILLEEIINPVDPCRGLEYGFNMSYFREIQPPISIADIFENELKQTV